MSRTVIAALVFIACFGTSVAHAVSISFTNRAAYDAAVLAFSNQETITFDAFAAPVAIPSGSSVGSITFHYAISSPTGPLTMVVTDAFPTSSPPNSLGLMGEDAFHGGDSFVMTIDHTVHAFGLYVLAEDLFPGDITVASNSGAATSNGALADFTLFDANGRPAGQAFFVGFTDTAGFTTVTLTSFPENYVFNVDDIHTGVLAEPTTAVPEPTTLALCASVATGLLAWRRRR